MAQRDPQPKRQPKALRMMMEGRYQKSRLTGRRGYGDLKTWRGWWRKGAIDAWMQGSTCQRAAPRGKTGKLPKIGPKDWSQRLVPKNWSQRSAEDLAFKRFGRLTLAMRTGLTSRSVLEPNLEVRINLVRNYKIVKISLLSSATCEMLSCLIHPVN